MSSNTHLSTPPTDRIFSDGPAHRAADFSSKQPIASLTRGLGRDVQHLGSVIERKAAQNTQY